MPLYQGGGISSREREAAATTLKSRQDLENARRTAALTTRQNYLAVINGIAQVAALEQALTSSQSALDSNRLGYEVGVRINIDVLNAQQQLFSTRRDLAVARYNAILNHLRLKAAAGSLRDEDLEEVNRALTAVAAAGTTTRCRSGGAAVRSQSALAGLAPCAGACASSLQKFRGLAHARAAASAACTAAPASSASCVASAKLNMCGPTITGAPAASASIRFWPPSGANEPPMTATSHAA